MLFFSNDKESSGKKSKGTFKRGSSIISLSAGTSDIKKDDNKAKPKSTNAKMKTRRRNSIPPDKDIKTSERKVGVANITNNLPNSKKVTEKTETISKKNSISEIVQSNILDQFKSSGVIIKRSHSVEELNTMRNNSQLFVSCFSSGVLKESVSFLTKSLFQFLFATVDVDVYLDKEKKKLCFSK